MMGFTWYILGILTIGSGYLLYEYSQKYRIRRVAWVGLIWGVFSMLFSVSWAVGAVLEGVPRAAGMGLVIFGLGGIIPLTVTTRFISKQSKKNHNKATFSE